MKKMWKILAAIIVIIFIARISLPQGDFRGGQKYDHFAYHDMYGLLQIGTSMKINNHKLNLEESYAISPDGDNLKIQTEPHQFDLEGHFPEHPYVRDRIYVIKSNGKRYEDLTYGRWEFHFTLDSPEGKVYRVFKGNISRFLYSPILHGLPL